MINLPASPALVLPEYWPSRAGSVLFNLFWFILGFDGPFPPQGLSLACPLCSTLSLTVPELHGDVCSTREA